MSYNSELEELLNEPGKEKKLFLNIFFLVITINVIFN